MTIILQLEPEIESRLISQANVQGTSVEELLSKLIESIYTKEDEPRLSINHNSFLNSYSPEDEGLYGDY